MKRLTAYIIVSNLLFWFSCILFLSQVAKINSNYQIILPENAAKGTKINSNALSFDETVGDNSLVIIIDDIGLEMESLNELATIKLPFTIAILPFQKYSKEAAYFAKEHGWEVIIHVPMEPYNYPEKDPGEKALMVNMSARQLQKNFEEMYENIPFAIGFNNHMGSKFTKMEDKLEPIMEIAKKKQLYFIDSKTTGSSVAYKVASKNGVRAAERTLFLDNEINENIIRQKLIELMNIAKDNKLAIGVCHTYPETKKILAELPLMLKHNKQTLVHASQALDIKEKAIFLASLSN
jgi:polysaccharide deacetylase 2 family uncharacterized protein YibQ